MEQTEGFASAGNAEHTLFQPCARNAPQRAAAGRARPSKTQNFMKAVQFHIFLTLKSVQSKLLRD